MLSIPHHLNGKLCKICGGCVLWSIILISNVNERAFTTKAYARNYIAELNISGQWDALNRSRILFHRHHKKGPFYHSVRHGIVRVILMSNLRTSETMWLRASLPHSLVTHPPSHQPPQLERNARNPAGPTAFCAIPHPLSALGNRWIGGERPRNVERKQNVQNGRHPCARMHASHRLVSDVSDEHFVKLKHHVLLHGFRRVS